MSDDEVEDQQVQVGDLDAGSGTQCFELDGDWVAYLAEADVPDNVTGVDPAIPDFDSPDAGHEEYTNV